MNTQPLQSPDLPSWIARAKSIATDAHRDQLRKDGAPYITHPAAVAAAVPDELKPIAWLHDVVEDTAVTFDDLRAAGMPDYVVEAVALLTKKSGEDYGLYLARVLANENARRVKIADIEHNLSGLPSEKNRVKYTEALAKLRPTFTNAVVVCPRVVFSHGRESGPWGTKIRTLADLAKGLGVEVESLDYSDISSPELRAERLSAHVAAQPGPVILVGSSMGGYASLVAATQQRARVRALFLMAPALFMPTYAEQEFPGPLPPVTLVHGWGDDVIPCAHSIRFAQEHGSDLLLVADDHRLKGRLDTVAEFFRAFLARHATLA